MKYEKSCGAIVYIEEDKVLKYLIISHKNGEHWDFPKGHVENMETELETASREVFEECGITISFIDGFRETIEYSPKENIIKEVVFLLAYADNKNIKIQEDEIIDYKWINFDDAYNLITYNNSRELLIKANRFIINKKAEYI